MSELEILIEILTELERNSDDGIVRYYDLINALQQTINTSKT